MTQSYAPPEVQVGLIRAIRIVESRETFNIAQKAWLIIRTRIRYASKDQLILCEGAGLVAQNVTDMPQLLIESEILHPSLLHLIQFIVRHHHLNIVLHHARIGHLCDLQSDQKRQGYQLVEENEIGSITIPGIARGINGLLFRKYIPHLGPVGTHPLVQSPAHYACERQQNYHVDEQQNVQLLLQNRGLKGVFALVQRYFCLFAAIKYHGDDGARIF